MTQSVSAIILVSLLYLMTRSTQTGSRINIQYSCMLSITQEPDMTWYKTFSSHRVGCEDYGVVGSGTM